MTQHESTGQLHQTTTNIPEHSMKPKLSQEYVSSLGKEQA